MAQEENFVAQRGFIFFGVLLGYFFLEKTENIALDAIIEETKHKS